MKYCEDCKWFGQRTGRFLWRRWLMPANGNEKCAHPKAAKSDRAMVSRNLTDSSYYCVTMRTGLGADRCGREGRLFEPRGPEPTP